MKTGYFKTKQRLQVAIDNYDKIDGMEDYLNSSFAYLMFDIDGGDQYGVLNGDVFDVPYWCLEGSIDYYLTGKQNYDPEKIMAQYRTGYYEQCKYGDIVCIDGIDYRFITTISLPEEMEHQAEDGGCVYDYRGSSFLRILEKIDNQLINYQWSDTCGCDRGYYQ